MNLPPKLLWVALAAVLTFAACTKSTDNTVSNSNGGNRSPSLPTHTLKIDTLKDNDHMLMGNPSNAIAKTDSANNFLMRKTYYALSYNQAKGEPNWVSWHLYAPDLGPIDRLNNFRIDSSLPTGYFRVDSVAYSGSGFDRGHNCPSADRTSTTDANSATFLMSNMIPQAPNNNEQTWANMENYLRTLVNAGNELYIIMGTYGVGGTGSKGYAATIDGGHVSVPAHIWKVAVVIPNGNGDLKRVDTTIRVIAADVPNNNSVNSNWKLYRTSVKSIQDSTGYNLLSNVDPAVQKVLEARIDNQ